MRIAVAFPSAIRFAHRARSLCATALALHAALACSGDGTSTSKGDGGPPAEAGGSGGTTSDAASGGRASPAGGSAGKASGTGGIGAGGKTSGSGTAGATPAGGVAGTFGTAGASGAGGTPSDDGGTGGRRTTESPWGIAPSHSSSVGIDSWASEIAKTGIDWIRGFDGANTDQVLKTATANGYQVSGIFFFSDPGPQATFPVNSIPQWKDYVSSTVRAARATVKNWEVWNEPPNFSANSSPADYAKIVIAGYDAAKAEDATVQIGLAAQSVNLNFLAEALDAGAAGHFDYVTVHPYETMGLVADGWEAEYMSIVPTIRKLLADKDPDRRDVPIWFTEVGEPVQGSVTADDQADTLVKAYVMGIAQGALRIHWFEPLDGDSGPFGLIGGGSGTAPKRPSYTAVSKLVEHLGHQPAYVGWLLLDTRHYAFVFDGTKGKVLVGWAPPKATAKVAFGATVHVTNLHTGASSDAASYDLTNSPILVTGVPDALVREAAENYAHPFPWNGDYSAAMSITYTAQDGDRGLHPVGEAHITTVDGGPARDIHLGPGQSFTVDPNFCSYAPTRLRVTAVLRRNGAGSAGFNLKYESTSGWKGTGSWYTVPGNDQWYTQTWTLSDTQFVGKWGYNFAFDSDSTQNSDYSIKSVTVTKE